MKIYGGYLMKRLAREEFKEEVLVLFSDWIGFTLALAAVFWWFCN